MASDNQPEYQPEQVPVREHTRGNSQVGGYLGTRLKRIFRIGKHQQDEMSEALTVMAALEATAEDSPPEVPTHSPADHQQWRESVLNGDIAPGTVQCPDGATRTGWEYVNPDGSPGGFVEAPESPFGMGDVVGNNVVIGPDAMVLQGAFGHSYVGDGVTLAGKTLVESSLISGDQTVITNSNVRNAVVEGAVLDNCGIYAPYRSMPNPDRDLAYISLDGGGTRPPTALRNVVIDGPAAVVDSTLADCEIKASVPWEARDPLWQPEIAQMGLDAQRFGSRDTLVIDTLASGKGFENSLVVSSALSEVYATGSHITGAGTPPPVTEEFMGHAVEPLHKSMFTDSYAASVSGKDLSVTRSRLERVRGENIRYADSVAQDVSLSFGEVDRAVLQRVTTHGEDKAETIYGIVASDCSTFELGMRDSFMSVSPDAAYDRPVRERLTREEIFLR